MTLEHSCVNADLVRRRAGQHGPYRARLNRVFRYVEANLHSRIPVSTLARIAGLSGGHFSRTFAQITGVPPQRYVRLRRIEAAQDMMCTTTDGLSLIAAACGVSDQSHLTKMFRQFVGLPPRRWRDQEMRRATELARARVVAADLMLD